MTERFVETSLDDFLDGKMRLYQPRKGFRAGQDSVLAASAVLLTAGDKILDIGAGAGAISMCLATREKECRITAVEYQAEYADLFRKSAKLNGRENAIEIVVGDIAEIAGSLPTGAYDQVVMNPPYFDPDTTRAPDSGRAMARHADAGLPESWIKLSRRFLKPRGYLTLVYAAEFLPGILTELQTGFGGVEVFPLWPSAGKGCRRLLVRARKNVKSPFTLHQGLYLRDANGRPTDMANAILREGKSLDTALQQFDSK